MNAFFAWVVAEVVVYSGIAYGMSQAMRPNLDGLALPSGSLNSGSPLQMSRDPVAPRRVIYGQTRVSGPMLFAQVSGAKNEYLHLLVALAGHECEEIGVIYINDETEALDGSGNATGNYSGLMRIIKHLGSPSQTADSNLVSETGGLWTTAHKLGDVAYIVGRLTWDQSKYPGGIPNLSSVVKGRKIYDLRDSGTRWTDNPALCIRDYLTNTTFGMGVDSSEIDDASFIAAANICDEAVALAAGGTEKRYTVNGTFDLSAEPATIMEKMTGAMAGLIVYISGKWYCQAGAHQTPTITLDENDLRGPISVQTKMSMRDTCNRVKGTFASPDEKWQPADFTPVVNSTYLSEDGGLEIWRDLDLPFTTSQAMAQRLAKIELERNRQDISTTMPCKLTALRAQAGDVVMVNNTRFGWSAKQFLVTGLKFSVYEAAGAPALGVDLTLRETASAVWDWNSGMETTYDPAPNTTLINPRVIAVPAGLALSTANFLQADGTISPRMQLGWTAPTDEFILSGGFVITDYKKHADADWINWSSVPGDTTREYITDVLAGVSYDVRQRFKNVSGVVGANCATVTYTVSTDVVAPATPTGLAATGGAGFILLDWADNPEADLDRYELYRNTSNSFPGGTPLWTGYASQHVDFGVTPSTVYYYWLKAVDTSENLSAATASVNASASSAGGLGTTGNYTDIIFKRAIAAPATPTGDTPAGWYDDPPADDGTYLWMAKGEKTSVGVLTGSWSTPIRLTSPADVAYLHIKFSNDGGTTFTGSGGEEIGTFMGTLRDITETDSATPSDYIWTPWGGGVAYAQYSINGSTSWHDTFTAGDLFARTKIGAGSWSAGYRIVGETGATGGYTEYIFRRAATPPATPTGDSPASPWFGSPPVADGNPLWMSVGDKTFAGVLVGAWATPVQTEGAGLVMEYSVNGTSDWHTPFASGDLYARQKVFGGSWSDPFKIVGEDGVDGLDGLNGVDLVGNPDFSMGNVWWESASNCWTLANNLGEGGAIWGAHPNVGSPSQLVNLQHFRVKSGERYTVRAHGKGVNGYSRITFFDAASAEIYYFTTPNFLSGWGFQEAFGSVPIGAVWARAEVLSTDGNTYCDSVRVQFIASGVVYSDPATTAPVPQWSAVDVGGGNRLITLISDDPASTLKYTVNGGTLTTYTAPFTVAANAVVVPRNTRSGYSDSPNTKLQVP